MVLIIGLIGLISIGAVRGEADWAPKLALDLEGGTQIVLAPKLHDGESVSSEQLQQAVAIIRQRVNASGVSEAEITTQGNQNIVVSIPGSPDKETLNRIERSAKLEFRPVLLVAAGTLAPSDATGNGDAAETPEGETPAEEAPAEDAPALDTAPETTPENASDPAWLTPGLLTQFAEFTCDSDAAQTTGDAPVDAPLITCDPSGTAKYVLGPVELGGEVITNAVAQMGSTSTGASNNQWAVQITMNDKGTKVFGKISSRLFGAQEPLNQFAFVLDGKVLSAPRMQAQILDGRPSISGDFSQESAEVLADQLKFGALPIGFEVQSQDTISATLGSNQLQSGLLAGLIGLVLVVIYSLFQYRLLGLLTVASLAIAAILTYLLLTYMSWREGYRLSLAGVAGVIVAIGITADSFIVYFERIRDELRDGRGIESAVEAGWKRAIRTVLASDGVNFLAAAILFLLAIGNVRGFAFTLGMTTIVDIVVVTLFTHPMMTLLARTKFYAGGHRLSGLDPRQLGAVYRGRANFTVAPSVGKAKKTSSTKEAQKRQTIAERKAAGLGQAESATSSSGKDA